MKQDLPRTLTQTDLVLLLVGTVIGSGIFLVPGGVLQQSGGHIGLALMVWLIGGILSLLGALTYGELGAMNPAAGGLYVYMRDAFGRLPAFLYGWTLFFVISSGSVATLAVAFARYAEQLIDLSPLVERLVAVGMIVVVAIVNVLGTRKSANVQNWTTGIKVAAIIVMSLALIAFGDGLGSVRGQAWPDVGAAGLVAGLGTAMIGVLWAYEGWQYVTFAAGETVEPERNFPRAMLIGTSALIAIYLLPNIAYIAALGPDGVVRSDRVASEAVTALMGPTAGNLIAAAILISIFSAANGLTLTAPRVYFAMARDRVFFSRLADIHPRFGTPAFAIVASSAWAVLLAATGTFEQLLTYVVFAGWIFYALGAMSIFAYRRRRPAAKRPFSVPLYPLTPLLFILAAAAIVLNTVIAQPGRALVGIAVVLLGAPAYLFWSSKLNASARTAGGAP
ncbi:MAG: amino acid permease [Acidobacteria bacterium]|nr:amino acid permease [Acidobacteriota bacterium]